MADDSLQIRSFRVVFDLERRIHRIDRFKVPLPYGLPLRSLGYGLAALVAVLVVSGLPVFGEAIGALPAPLRFVLLPTAAAIALTRIRIDGRAAHAAGLAWLRFALAPRELVALRPCPHSSKWRMADLWTLDERTKGSS